ncbi:MAG: hypothetical protein ABW072_13300 [Sedimenticola sp.]
MRDLFGRVEIKRLKLMVNMSSHGKRAGFSTGLIDDPSLPSAPLVSTTY